MIEHALFVTGSSQGCDVIAAAKGLIPTLRERSAATEKAARLPDETVADLVKHGLLSLFKPRRHGGKQISFGAGVNVVRTLAAGDSSVAWVAAVTMANSFLLPMLFSPEATAEVYADPNACAAGAASTLKFKGRLVDGGLSVEEGVWGYNSGVYHAQWDILAMSMIDEGTGASKPMVLLVPTSDLETLDDWRVTGLAGTGSTTVRLRGFVPRHRIATLDANGADSAEYKKDPLYRTDAAMLGAFLLHSVLLGSARGALEVFLAHVRGRRILYTHYTDQSQAPTTHYRVGEACAMLDAADAAAKCGVMMVEAAATENRSLTDAERVRLRASLAYAAVVAKTVVNNLAEIAGASIISQSNMFNRFWRNIHAGTPHPALAPSPVFEALGRIGFGGSPDYAPR